MLAGLALIPAPRAGAQDAGPKHSINISRQALTPALAQLSLQTGVNYLYLPDSAAQEEIQVGPIIGQYTVDEALTLLLQSTGLTFARVNSRSITIVPAPPPLLQVESKSRPPHGAQPTQSTPPRNATLIAEVTTAASKFKHLPAPSAAGLVLDREEIARTGAPTIMDLLRTVPQQPFLRPNAFRSNGAQYAELRGLGPDTTQVLINGHRAFASAASFTVNAFDLNQVPLSAVERVEVQLDSISVRHGADAIGGIVNIVLRDDIADPSVEVRYGSADGGGEERQAAISAGYTRKDVRASVVLDYRDVAPLFGAQRALWRDQDYRRFGGSDWRSTISSPGNVMALTPGGLLPGLGAPFAAIVESGDGPVTKLSEFIPFELNRESLLQYFPIIVEDRRASAVAGAQANITSDLVAAADLLVVDRRVGFASLPPPVSAVVPQTNPYNPFGEPVLVTGLLDGADPLQANVDSLLVRGSGSLRGQVKGWEWELSVLRSAEDARQQIDNVLDPVRLAAVLANPDREHTLDLFGPGPAASLEVLATVLAPSEIDRYATDAMQLAGVLSGNLFALPAGNLSTLLGAEWREEAVQFDSSLGSYDREVAGAFAELHVPLLEELTATVAGRFDRYSDFGQIFSPQYGLVWRPLRDVAIRGTYGRSFRPPSLYDLYLPNVALAATQIFDPRRNGERYSTTMIAGGSPDLEATRGESLTAGVEFTPEAIRPLILSATYWRVKMDQRVTALNSTFALLHEVAVADRVLRAEPTAADVAAGLPGRVLQIDATRMNFGRLITSGIDFGASYAFDTAAGRFAADVKATWTDEYQALDLPGSPATDRVDVANVLGTIAKWRAVASLDWRRGALGATTYVRHVPSYDDTRDGVLNGRTVPSQTFLDLQLGVDLGKLFGGGAVLRGLTFTAGALNALDQQPHFAEVNGIQGYDTSQGDLAGRFWYLQLGKSF